MIEKNGFEDDLEDSPFDMAPEISKMCDMK
jgi:hypothetical protein